MSTAIPGDVPRRPTTAVGLPRLPSLDEIEREMQIRMPGLTIYNPSNLWIQLQVFGLTHIWATPDLDGRLSNHPVTGKEVSCTGRTELKGRFFKQKDSSGHDIVGQDAGAMVKVVISAENYGQMGMVWLPGESPELDDILIEKSQAVWLAYRELKDEDIVNRRAEFKANWDKNPRHRGETCPPPTEAEMAAMDRLRKRKHQAEWKFTCPVSTCLGYASNEWESFISHMSEEHKVNDLERAQFDKQGGLAVGNLVSTQAQTPEQKETAAAANALLLQLLEDLKRNNEELQARLLKLEGGVPVPETKAAGVVKPDFAFPVPPVLETSPTTPPTDDDGEDDQDDDEDKDDVKTTDKPRPRSKGRR